MKSAKAGEVYQFTLYDEDQLSELTSDEYASKVDSSDLQRIAGHDAKQGCNCAREP